MSTSSGSGGQADGRAAFVSWVISASLPESSWLVAGSSRSKRVGTWHGCGMARIRLSTTVDASYAAYDAHPLDERDEWGDLASFRRAVAAS